MDARTASRAIVLQRNVPQKDGHRGSVNVAARVQDATKELGERLLVSEATLSLVETEPALEPRGELWLRGKSRPIAVRGLQRS